MQPTLIPHALAALLGARLACVDERYRPMARALLILLSARAAFEGSRLFRPDRIARKALYAAGIQAPPYEGVARASWAVEQVATVAWYAAIAWAVWRALKDDCPKRGRLVDVSPASGNARSPCYEAVPVRLGGSSRVGAAGILSALALLASSVFLFAVYPAVRGRPVELAATVVFCAALAMQLVAATRYILHWRRPDAARGVALVLVAGSVADAAGPFLMARPASDWFSGEPVGVLIWSVVGGVTLWGIVTRRES